MRDGQRDTALVRELTPVVEGLLERHLASSREWFPHELVPWSRGRDFVAGEAWDPDEFALPDAVRSALFVNLLTEDNLPYYFATINQMFGDGAIPGDDAWAEWARRWTAEEMRHSIVIRDWLTVSRALDPVALERARMAQVSQGLVPQPESVADGLVYVALQELATQISHRNTGRLLHDKAGAQVMARVAGDETLHHVFYRDLTTAAFEVDPSAMTCALARQVVGFEMPGTGIVDFDRHALAIAGAEIYDFGVHHEQILEPMLEHWQVSALEGLTAEAEDARTRVFKHTERVGKAARRARSRRERQVAPV
ncbi:MAG TPA: acyl-ACP desaturase [Acidimicrobiia bacterium]|nr:acyl-ACP desaturase [Acidimicrobiia bacterium]